LVNHSRLSAPAPGSSLASSLALALLWLLLLYFGLTSLASFSLYFGLTSLASFFDFSFDFFS
jgi:hypothetical protein